MPTVKPETRPAVVPATVSRGAGLISLSDGAARFDGRKAYIEVPAAKTPALGTKEFSLAVRVHTAKDLDDVLGDIVSLYDPKVRRGFNFAVVHNVGAAQVRRLVLGDEDVAPSEEQLGEMKKLLDQAMKDGAVGLSTSLIYPPGTYATPEEIVRELPPRLQELLGYGVYPPFVGNVDGRHPRKYLEDARRVRNGVLEPDGAS